MNILIIDLTPIANQLNHGEKMERIGKRFVVTGKVQGVFFRDSTRTKAQELGITGWVRNDIQGHVECFAFGTPEKISIFEAWLWEGPRKAEVKSVTSEIIPVENASEFVIVFT